ncbi:MAG TPA: hypothetical protein VMF89_23635, partial [Polyangiales bacterium]|nr:hypothetical protein [Polyangiales bacterium]
MITSGVLACVLWLATSAISSSANAAFSCGPGWLLYRNGDGVRCVHRAADSKFVWYGEGHDGDWRYRHIGVVRWDPDREGFYGSAADIHGNNASLVAAGQEESPANHFDGDIRWTSQGETPDTIHISPWNDTWTRVPSGSVDNYTTPFIEPAIDCDLFRGGKATLGKYRAQRIEESGTQRVNGVRCALKLEGGQTYWDVWYGAGTLFFRDDLGPSNNPMP